MATYEADKYCRECSSESPPLYKIRRGPKRTGRYEINRKIRELKKINNMSIPLD